MFFVAYRVPSARPRPVTFLWNGGPGSPSSTLHLRSVGPRRLEADGVVSDFDDTALTDTDLVFVDAPGTGFSRIAKPEYAKQFYQMRGDVAAFTEFVRAWRLLFRAEESPIYLGGESWGSFRAPAVALALEKRHIRVSGIIAISGRPGLLPGDRDTTLVALRTVQQAVAAQMHGKLSPTLPTDLNALQKLVRSWVISTYVPALDHIATLDDRQRDEVARQLASYIGVPERDIDRQTLVITPHAFRENLLGQGKTLTAYDMTHTVDDQDQRQPQDIEHYLRGELGYLTDRAYVQPGNDLHGFSPDAGAIKNPNALWDFSTGFFDGHRRREEIEAINSQLDVNGEVPLGQDTPDGADAMALNPSMRMLIVNGLYDSMASCASSAELVSRQSPDLQRRITFRCYEGGHMFYEYPKTQYRFSDDIKALVKGRN